ncbi:MAG: hypothetical protein WCB85_14315 [Candidatus Dormiibacterota bacterium]
MYDLIFSERAWPRGVVPRCISDYVERGQIRAVRAFAGASTPYARAVRQVGWRKTGIQDALLISAQAPSGGALALVPRGLGQAARAFLGFGIPRGWRSTDGLPLLVERLH